MNQTKIEWCDCTWNPVTGCLHGCPYCYAQRQAHRFGGYALPDGRTLHAPLEGETCVLDEPFLICRKNGKMAKASFPYDFTPTFHRYRLDEPEKDKEPKNIFVVSMGDLFGKWVPKEWIEEIFAACERAPWHRYLFLTKNPSRYRGLNGPKNAWYGATVVNSADFVYPCRTNDLLCSDQKNTFLSIEPLQSKLYAIALDNLKCFKWVIVGAETGNRKEKTVPQRKWIKDIVDSCHTAGIPVFMKNSLTKVWGAPLIQEFPWSKEDNSNA